MKLNFIKKSQYLYELQPSPELKQLFENFFNVLPESKVDYILEDEFIKNMLSYVVARYVYSKDISYAEMWNNVEVVIPSTLINEFIPDFNKNVRMSISKTDYVDPLTKEPMSKHIYSTYEYE